MILVRAQDGGRPSDRSGNPTRSSKGLLDANPAAGA